MGATTGFRRIRQLSWFDWHSHQTMHHSICIVMACFASMVNEWPCLLKFQYVNSLILGRWGSNCKGTIFKQIMHKGSLGTWYEISHTNKKPGLVETMIWCRQAWASCQICKFTDCACAGNVGNVSSPARVSDPDMHHGTCVTHVPWCMSGSQTSGFLWRRWRGKRSRRLRNLQF